MDLSKGDRGHIGPLSEDEDEQLGIGLRWHHLGLHFPGQVVRLDLYRLVCYFHSSKYFSDLTDGGDFCPWHGLKDEFESPEIIRILLQTAVSVRFIGMGNADKLREDREVLEEKVGTLYKRVESQHIFEPLTLREACNKLIHARNIVADSNGDGNPYFCFLKPGVFCYEQFDQKSGWKAEIDVLLFVEICSQLAALFG